MGSTAYYSIPKVAAQQVISTAKWTALFNDINTERTRRGVEAIPTPGFTGLVYANKLNSLIDAIPGTYTGSITSVSVGTLITAEHFNLVIDKLNSAGAAYCNCNCNYCTCNCNYCTCNCNYCTCNCNYCTCNCNYCTCNCNYSCTCNCNYSDKRLKTNIKFLRFEGDIKMYSYNYIFDTNITYEGVIAQDLIGTKYENALSKDDLDYFMVDYSLLPVKLKEING